MAPKRGLKRPAAAIEYEGGAAGGAPAEAPTVPLATPSAAAAAAPAAVASAAPAGWEEVMRLILEQRRGLVSDSDRYGGLVWTREANTAETRLHTLINSILAPQCQDKVVFDATSLIIAKARNLDQLLALPPAELDACCAKIRMRERKTKALLAAAAALRDSFGGDVPRSFAELTSLPGVGPKSAAFLLMACWGQEEAIKVDTHVHRVCSRLGWVAAPSEEATRRALEAWVPKAYWGLGGLKQFAGFGQVICTARSPKCKECAVKHLCPSAELF